MPDDPALTQQKIARVRAEANARDLKRAIDKAIDRHARAWGIRFDQARSLLMDWKAVA